MSRCGITAVTQCGKGSLSISPPARAGVDTLHIAASSPAMLLELLLSLDDELLSLLDDELLLSLLDEELLDEDELLLDDDELLLDEELELLDELQSICAQSLHSMRPQSSHDNCAQPSGMSSPPS